MSRAKCEAGSILCVQEISYRTAPHPHQTEGSQNVVSPLDNQ